MAKAMEGFAAAVEAVEPHHWERRSPCSEWSVWDVINHVVAGEHFTAEVLSGASLEAAVEPQVGLDPQNPDLVSQAVELGHTWDVATATGQSANLDADALAIGTEIALIDRPTLERSPNFATSPHDRGTTGGDQLTSFLHVIGRTIP